MLLAKSISSFEYSSGAFPFLPDTYATTAGTLSICSSLQCSMQIEFPCYGLDVGRADKCSHCEGNNAVVTQELKDLRLCSDCASCALTTERSLLHRVCMERDKNDFFVCKCNFINGYVTSNHY